MPASPLIKVSAAWMALADLGVQVGDNGEAGPPARTPNYLDMPRIFLALTRFGSEGQDPEGRYRAAIFRVMRDTALAQLPGLSTHGYDLTAEESILALSQAAMLRTPGSMIELRAAMVLRSVAALCQDAGAKDADDGESDDALSAFSSMLELAWQAKEVRRQSARHAAKAFHEHRQSIFHEAWQHYKSSGYRSLAEGARACARHYQEFTPNRPEKARIRSFRDYFARRAKEEGLEVRPGRKPTRTRKAPS